MNDPATCPVRVPTYGEPIEELNRIKIKDNGEPLVEILKLCPEITFAADHPRFPGAPRTCWARKTVAEMMCRAQSHLPDGLHLEIQDAWRSPESQMKLFTLLSNELRSKNPAWTESELLEHANQFVANPFISAPPPHTTGGAVDVTVMNAAGEMLDMTSPYGWSEISAPTSYTGISKEARRNRHILIEAMSKAGFSNYLGEWWHWSYGDSAWALRAGLDTAIYGEASGPTAETDMV
jgi:D-alanyl-D-alanine dipeptidase